MSAVGAAKGAWRYLLPMVPALALVLSPLAAPAQRSRVPRIGVLLNSSANENLRDFREGLRDLGYSEGQTITLEVLSADGRFDRLPALAAELVRRRVDVIVASGPQGVGAARQASASVPIVMGRMDDVDAHGLVTNLAHPGGNVTGLSFQTGELAGKWVHLLKEATGLSRLAVMWDDSGTRNQLMTTLEAARALGLEARVLEMKGAQGLDSVVSAARAVGAEGLVILASPAFTDAQERLARLLARGRLPGIYYHRGFAAAGGLLSYGPRASDFSWRRAAVFVDKILKGARPGDLPVEQPTTFELVVNLGTARTLGLTIPPSVLARADEVLR